MKIRVLIIYILILMCVSIFTGSSKKEVLFGTWINTEYEGAKYWSRTAKRVIDPNPNAFGENIESDIGKPSGSMGYYSNIADTETSDEATIAITEKWTDDEGNRWYKVKYYLYSYNTIAFMLCKIDDSGETLEFMVSDWRFPELDADSYEYRIYFRQ